MKRFTLNVAPILIESSQEWIFYELIFESWEHKYYAILRNFRQSYSNDDLILENEGRILGFISNSAEQVSQGVVLQTLEEIQKQFDVKITQKKIDYAEILENNAGRNCIKNIIGRLISIELKKLGFEKVGSKGSIGRYYHFEYSNPMELQREKVTLRRLYDFIVLATWSSQPKFYLAIDIKAEVKGTETLDEIRAKRKNFSEKDVSEWPQNLRKWKINSKDLSPNFDKLKSEKYELIELKTYGELENQKVNLLKHGKYITQTLFDFNRENKLGLQKNSSIARVRPSRSPNVECLIPSSNLEHQVTIHSMKGESYENKFKNYSKLKLLERKNSIGKIFDLLKQQKLVTNLIRFDGYYPKIARPSVNGKTTKFYGERVNFSTHGFEEWGKLEKITIYSRQNKYEEKVANLVKQELTIKFKSIAGLMKRKNLKVNTMQINVEECKNIADNQTIDPEKELHLFIFGKGKENFSYKLLKTWFTAQNKKPIQVVRVNSLHGYKKSVVIQNLIPQIIAKTGGHPYSLSPKILENTLIIGLDKSRDAHSTKPSASAGIAAVTSEGRYIAGASTPLDNTKDDRIDVDKIAPQLLQELKDKYKNKLDYIIILRDGAPQICQEEIKPWQKHVEKHNMKFLFFASRKENAYRVFPTEIIDNKTKFKLPVILTGEPLQNSEFLVISANAVQGTPQPVLYTLMENTTNYTDADIKTKVIPQIISLSMLCWESSSPTSQPLPLHYADKLGEFTTLVEQAWNSSIKSPQFI